MAGVMIGVELTTEGAPFVKACLETRLLINCTQNTVIRLLPAMNLTIEQANEGLDVLASVLIENIRRSHETGTLISANQHAGSSWISVD